MPPDPPSPPAWQGGRPGRPRAQEAKKDPGLIFRKGEEGLVDEKLLRNPLKIWTYFL